MRDLVKRPFVTIRPGAFAFEAVLLVGHQGDFSLERLAARLDVEVAARHTAEGDALTAGLIFLAIVPEQEARRVRTVSELLWLQRHAAR